MAINHHDLDGTISVIDFSLTFGTTSLSSDKQKVVISYTGYAYPELSNVALDTYEYSLDNGSTWTSMTPSGSTPLTSLSFTEAGTAHTFEWMAKEDAEMNFYNTNVRIRINAISGIEETGLTYGSFYLERAVENLSTAAQASSFPDSYSGQSGADLVRLLAPKLQ
jgi:hypothetical protein